MSGDNTADQFPSIANFRDFGGYASSFGGHVARDRLYRCGHLAKVRKPEVEALLGLDFALIADLRYPGERETEKSPWTGDYLERVIAHDGNRSGEAPHLVMLSRGGVDAAMIEGFYTEFYAELPFNKYYKPLFGRVLAALATCPGRALVHCTAGKDRTGMLVALLHRILGVSPADMLADYMQSLGAKGLKELVPRITRQIESKFGYRPELAAVEMLLAVSPDYLALAFASIDKTCGSLDSYLDSIGVTEDKRNAIRSNFLV